MTKQEKGRQWDGKSRVSTDLYRKRFDEIFKKKKASQANAQSDNIEMEKLNGSTKKIN
tara:strand:- start:1900 stop:2073 length:174 start_codon:yes stop_codon:yes gene_type:complete